jgi:hypothetical protein
MVTKALFKLEEPPRWLILIGIGGIALIDRNKWNHAFEAPANQCFQKS